MIQTAENKTASEVAGLNMPREIARFNMIEQQIRTWEVLDPVVLALLNEIPREHFVPTEYQGLAFADIEIPIGAGQNMLSPKLEGRILQALSVQKSHNVLHIGTGSGYVTALLASLAKHVTSVEINAELSAKAAQNLTKHSIQNVSLLVEDGALGLPNQAPFDLIVYTGSSPVEPIGVRNQLAIGGSLFIVLGTGPAMQATLVQRLSEAGFRQDVLFETYVPELVNAPQASTFEF
ncbi:Pcm Protein-L-isoaspartate carboxylmethyltransferase [Methylophilaceae bacterium]|jgi:protein-L-isoaspartate(D-aspartate) O-methyltransferase